MELRSLYDYPLKLVILSSRVPLLTRHKPNYEFFVEAISQPCGATGDQRITYFPLTVEYVRPFAINLFSS